MEGVVDMSNTGLGLDQNGPQDLSFSPGLLSQQASSKALMVPSSVHPSLEMMQLGTLSDNAQNFLGDSSTSNGMCRSLSNQDLRGRRGGRGPNPMLGRGSVVPTAGRSSRIPAGRMPARGNIPNNPIAGNIFQQQPSSFQQNNNFQFQPAGTANSALSTGNPNPTNNIASMNQVAPGNQMAMCNRNGAGRGMRPAVQPQPQQVRGGGRAVANANGRGMRTNGNGRGAVVGRMGGSNMMAYQNQPGQLIGSVSGGGMRPGQTGGGSVVGVSVGSSVPVGPGQPVSQQQLRAGVGTIPGSASALYASQQNPVFNPNQANRQQVSMGYSQSQQTTTAGRVPPGSGIAMDGQLGRGMQPPQASGAAKQGGNSAAQFPTRQGYPVQGNQLQVPGVTNGAGIPVSGAMPMVAPLPPTSLQSQTGQMQTQLTSQQIQQAQTTQQLVAQPQQSQRGLQLVGGWQSDNDKQARRKMIARIMQLLNNRKPNARPEWKQKVPSMARRLEDSLYRSASSFDEYSDLRTLKGRLQQLALKLGLKAQMAKQGGPMINNTPMSSSSASISTIPGSSSLSQPMYSNADQTKGRSTGPVFVNMNDINPSLMGTQGGAAGNMLASGGTSNYAGFLNEEGSKAMNGGGSSEQQKFTPEQKRAALKQQQQRLLLLRHASRCPTEPPEQCHYTDSCSRMKKLWKHISGCKDQSCKTSHCVSSRYLLSHYHRCKDESCPVCNPVREAIKRNQILSCGAGHKLAQCFIEVDGSCVLCKQQLSKGSKTQGCRICSYDICWTCFQFRMERERQKKQMKLADEIRRGAQELQPFSAPQATNGGGSTTENLLNVMHAPAALGTGDFSFMDQLNKISAGELQGASVMDAGLDGNHAGDQRPEKRLKIEEDCTDQRTEKRVKIEEGSTVSILPPQQITIGQNALGFSVGEGGAEPLFGAPVLKPTLSSELLPAQTDRCKLEGSSAPASPLSSKNTNFKTYIPGTGQPSGDDHPSVLKLENQCDGLIKSEPASQLSQIIVAPAQSKVDPSVLLNPVLKLEPSVPPIKIPASVVPGIIKLGELPGAITSSAFTSNSKGRGKIGKIAGSREGPVAAITIASAPAGDGPRQVIMGTVAALTETSGLETAEEGTSLVQGFTIEEIETHIRSLETTLSIPVAELRKFCSPLLKTLLDHQYGWIFDKPVDPIGLGLADYFEIIKHPMDLGTVKKRLENGVIKTVDMFRDDVELTFNNAMIYNQEGTDVHVVAKDMLKTFRSDMKGLMKKIVDQEEKKKLDGEACSLCGQTRLIFEPMVYYCNGVSCNGQRIRRSSNFYAGGNNRYHWCQQCYNELKPDEPIHLMDCTLKRDDLQKKKNNEQNEEPWVECDNCKRWVHQVCALFNGRKNHSDHAVYFCPRCIISKRKQVGRLEPTGNKTTAQGLPDTELSKFITAHIEKQLELMYQEEAAAKNIPIEQVDKCPRICIKQVSCIDKPHFVREYMRERYADKGYPTEFPVRIKCLVMFQELGGVDVILFGMYLYEYGHQCKRPNQRSVYISYLDSVHYFKPRKYRTRVYHEMLVSYLEYVKNRGFHSCYIWACPPLKGDDYILYCHPEDQKTPRDERLRDWYKAMLVTAKERGIVVEINNLFDEFFRDPALDPTVLPYFEGDYWVGEAENVIKILNDEANGLREARKDKRTSKGATSKSKGSKAGRRVVSLQEDGSRDPLMVRLGNNIEPMKESFFVAYMQPKEVRDDQWARYQLQLEMEEAKANPDHPKHQEALSYTALPDETEDTKDEMMENEFFDTRQAFLNLCQGNHYQFDQLRRAKHSSMMVLYHLYNPDAPKFLSTCANCLKEIVTGKRHFCGVCTEFNLCDACMSRGLPHPHPLTSIPVRSQETQKVMTDEQREQRRRTIKLHMQLLLHTSTCVSPECPSSNCHKMKDAQAHFQTCLIKAQGGCSQCRRMMALLTFHARMCKKQNCEVHKCQQLKEHYKLIAQQQLQMDDRRRIATNERQRAETSSSAPLVPEEEGTASPSNSGKTDS